jgi:hypothetical protein
LFGASKCGLSKAVDLVEEEEVSSLNIESPDERSSGAVELSFAFLGDAFDLKFKI